MSFHVVLHHVAEILIARFLVPHQHADHLQNIRALGIHHAPIRARGFRSIQAQPQRDRPGIVGGVAEIVFLGNLGVQTVPANFCTSPGCVTSRNNPAENSAIFRTAIDRDSGRSRPCAPTIGARLHAA